MMLKNTGDNFLHILIKKIGADELESIYKEAHQKIRENPVLPKKPRRETDHYKVLYRQRRKNTKQRKHRIQQKLQAMEKAAAENVDVVV